MAAAGAEQLDVRVLGPIEASVGGDVVHLGSAKQRAVLAMLVVHRRQPILVDEITEQLWTGSPPANPAASVHAYVSNLRRLLGLRLAGTGGGYHLQIEERQLDAGRFEALAAQGKLERLRARQPGVEPVRRAR